MSSSSTAVSTSRTAATLAAAACSSRSNGEPASPELAELGHGRLLARDNAPVPLSYAARRSSSCRPRKPADGWRHRRRAPKRPASHAPKRTGLSSPGAGRWPARCQTRCRCLPPLRPSHLHGLPPQRQVRRTSPVRPTSPSARSATTLHGSSSPMPCRGGTTSAPCVLASDARSPISSGLGDFRRVCESSQSCAGWGWPSALWALRERRPARGHRRSRAGLARRLRMAAEALGPTYIKLGQIISSGEGLFPEELVGEFSKCRDQVPPEPFADVRRRGRGRPRAPARGACSPRSTAQPLAAASIAQVHAAHAAHRRARSWSRCSGRRWRALVRQTCG